MKISRAGSLNSSPLRRTGKAKGHAAGSFTSHLSVDGGAGNPQSVTGVKATGGVDALLSVQEMGDALDSESRARQRAEDILDRLDEVRHGLLTGALSRHQLENLARLVRHKRDTVSDPRLVEILDQIELRAEVELAKYSTLD